MCFTKLFILLSCAGQFPSADCLIAPGMRCTYTVTFSPDSLANYQDELRVPVCFVYCSMSSRFYLTICSQGFPPSVSRAKDWVVMLTTEYSERIVINPWVHQTSIYFAMFRTRGTFFRQLYNSWTHNPPSTDHELVCCNIPSRPCPYPSHHQVYSM